MEADNSTDAVARIAAIKDPFDLLRAATAQLSVAQQQVTELSRLRRRTIQDLHESGMSYAQIAEAAGLSRGRIHQIRHGGPAPEAAFLGVGQVTIATPLKQEAIKGRPVVAVEDVTGAQRLGDYARSVGLEPFFENVPVGGAIDLNRPNLVVICGPRLSEPVAEILAQDSALQFERAADGTWTLVDRRSGEVFRSGQDKTPAFDQDYAYLGRLRRPDDKGSVLVFTGIHPAGSLGVIHLLTTRLAELFAEVRTDEFSVIVSTDFDPDTREPIAVEMATPIHHFEEV